MFLIAPYYDLNKRIDLSCAKKLLIGDPVTGSCGNNDKSGGLCHHPCEKGFIGVRPVCLGTIPSGWVECGMGAAKSSMTCTKTIFIKLQAQNSLLLA
jgi:hypothetical protein